MVAVAAAVDVPSDGVTLDERWWIKHESDALIRAVTAPMEELVVKRTSNCSVRWASAEVMATSAARHVAAVLSAREGKPRG